MKHIVDLTTHAQTRMNQRAIPMPMISFLMIYGEQIDAGEGLNRLQISKKNTKKLRNDLKTILRRLDSLTDTYLIANDEGTVITVGHHTKRFRKNH